MKASILVVLAGLALGQNKGAPNLACGALTDAEVTSLIGHSKTLPVSSAPNGASCMFQNQDRMVTVLMVAAASQDIAKSQWTAKKRISQGQDVGGIGTEAYAGAMVDTVTGGFHKGS